MKRWIKLGWIDFRQKEKGDPLRKMLSTNLYWTVIDVCCLLWLHSGNVTVKKEMMVKIWKWKETRMGWMVLEILLKDVLKNVGIRKITENS